MKDVPAISGILLIDKQAGPTSHDVVNRVRSLFGMRRVGHAGTLDPFATGLMVMLLGKATRLSEYLTAGDKGYSGVIQLGVTTDTGDRTGSVNTSRPCLVTADGLERVRLQLIGVSEQIPPMYSAVRVDGRRLHELARMGLVAQRRPRRITIHELALDIESSGDFPVVAFRVQCSKGTYVRVMAEEVGSRLDAGANVLELRRLASGSWRVADAVRLEELAAMPLNERVSRVLPLADALPEMPAVKLREGEREMVASGKAVNTPITSDAAGEFREGALVKLLTVEGELAAVAVVDELNPSGTAILRPRKVFITA